MYRRIESIGYIILSQIFYVIMDTVNVCLRPMYEGESHEHAEESKTMCKMFIYNNTPVLI